jgi:hypothetical protein
MGTWLIGEAGCDPSSPAPHQCLSKDSYFPNTPSSAVPLHWSLHLGGYICLWVRTASVGLKSLLLASCVVTSATSFTQELLLLTNEHSPSTNSQALGWG